MKAQEGKGTSFVVMQPFDWLSQESGLSVCPLSLHMQLLYRSHFSSDERQCCVAQRRDKGGHMGQCHKTPNPSHAFLERSLCPRGCAFHVSSFPYVSPVAGKYTDGLITGI